jgi:hypothetical protein
MVLRLSSLLELCTHSHRMMRNWSSSLHVVLLLCGPAGGVEHLISSVKASFVSSRCDLILMGWRLRSTAKGF